jgi:hypothetical protein
MFSVRAEVRIHSKHLTLSAYKSAYLSIPADLRLYRQCELVSRLLSVQCLKIGLLAPSGNRRLAP